MSLVTPTVRPRPPSKAQPQETSAELGGSGRSSVGRALVILVFLIGLGLCTAQVFERFCAVTPAVNLTATLPLPA